MALRQSTKDQQMRQRIAQEAARLMAEQGLSDFYAAKRKAAERLGAVDTRNLPKNTEVEQALIDYQRLFGGARHVQRLKELRETALEAMRFLAPFSPRLVGSVLRGTARDHSAVRLHVFTDTAEELAFFLMDEQIPFETDDRRLRVNTETSELYPVYRFVAGDATVELTVFPVDGLRQAPLSPVDGRPMQRANTAAVEALLAEEGEAEREAGVKPTPTP